MNTYGVTVRYAKALSIYAEEQEVSALVYKEMQCLYGAFRNCKEFVVTLNNPVLPSTEKRKLIEAAIGGDTVSEVSKRFIDLALKHRRVGLLGWMALHYIAIYREKKQIYEGELCTASPLKQETKKRIEQWILKGKQGRVELLCKEDEKLIGGFTLRLGDRRWNVSVKGQLERMKSDLLQNKKGGSNV